MKNEKMLNQPLYFLILASLIKKMKLFMKII